MSLNTIIMLSTVEVFGDINARWYAQTNQPMYLAGGIIGYAGILFYLIEALRTHNVLYVNGMWDGISAIIESVAAFVLLGDRLKKPEQYAGIGLIIAGLLLLREHV